MTSCVAWTDTITSSARCYLNSILLSTSTPTLQQLHLVDDLTLSGSAAGRPQSGCADGGGAELRTAPYRGVARSAHETADGDYLAILPTPRRRHPPMIQTRRSRPPDHTAPIPEPPSERPELSD